MPDCPRQVLLLAASASADSSETFEALRPLLALVRVGCGFTDASSSVVVVLAERAFRVTADAFFLGGISTDQWRIKGDWAMLLVNTLKCNQIRSTKEL